MNLFQPVTPRPALALAALLAAATALVAAETEYDNYVNVAGAASSVHGDKAAFEKLTQQNKSGWGGLSGFHYGQDLNKDTALSFDGHALAGNDDIQLQLKLTRNDVGYVAAGYTSYRTWFDGSGGYLPITGTFVELYNDEMYITRRDLWVEVGITPPEKVNFNFRYDYTTREGLKDSSSWGDVTLPVVGTRAIVPTFLRINESRHIFNAKAFQDAEATSWEVAGRYETSTFNNAREIHRAPGSATQDRYVTQDDGANSDLFMMRGSVETKVSEWLTMSTGMAHYDIDTAINGSRIYGGAYDPTFSATYAHRQYHDEGFYGMEGNTHMNQTLANLNLMYTPTETLSIVPSLLAEKTTWGGKDEYVEAAVGAPPSLAMSTGDIAAESNRSFRTLTAMVEGKYTGVKNVVLNADLEVNGGYGLLDEDLAEAETGESTIARATDYRRQGQKYAFTGIWYAQPGLSFTGQYYWKGKQNGFVNESDSVSADPTSGDRYPGYITHQDYETNDANLRVTWSPVLNVRTVSRYDYQETTIRTQEIAQPFIQSGKIQTHMLSETVTWNPLDRLFLQASGNLVFDRTTTPAHSVGGVAGQSVLNSDNNYATGELMAGYALDDQSDISATYTYYRANDYVDNSIASVPYGANQRYETVSVQWFRRMTPQLNLLAKYAYGNNDDAASGGYNNFRAHTVYAQVQYRF